MCYGVLTLEVSGQGEDLLSIVQDIHALGVGVVAHSERARNTSSKNTETSDKEQPINKKKIAEKTLKQTKIIQSATRK